LAIAEEIADRVGIVERGQLKFLGTLDELRSQLASSHASLESLYLSFMGNESGLAEKLPDRIPQQSYSPEGPAP
jgi:ABC-2 type transport system ATP-binding protein